MKKEWRNFIFGVISDIFYISFFTYLVYASLELVWPRFVSAYFNLNALLFLVLISGTITIVKR